MNLLFVISFLLCNFGVVFALGRGDLEKYGLFQLVLKSSLIKCEHRRTLNLDVSGINVHFYDFSKKYYKTFPLLESAKRILSMKNFNINKHINLYIGGFKSEIRQPNQEQIRRAFKRVPNSYLIIPDHSQYTHNRDGELKSYARSVKYVHNIGKALAQMLATLVKGGVSAKNIHCTGHSLGGQILGQLGEQFIAITGQKLARISALDPAGPCFYDSLRENQVRAGIADYVEVYHCNSGALGSSSVLGDVDFFLNDGENQPNCGTPLIPEIYRSSKAASCSHQMCVDLWIATIMHPKQFVALKCDSYENFKNGKCRTNVKTVAGFWNPGYARGQYYISSEDYDLTALNK